MKVYRPERFLKGSPDGPDTRHPFAELSFGAGPHKCIGYRYWQPLASLQRYLGHADCIPCCRPGLSRAVAICISFNMYASKRLLHKRAGEGLSPPIATAYLYGSERQAAGAFWPFKPACHLQLSQTTHYLAGLPWKKLYLPLRVCSSNTLSTFLQSITSSLLSPGPASPWLLRVVSG